MNPMTNNDRHLWAVKHELEVVRLRLGLGTGADGVDIINGVAQGTSGGKRTPLWTETAVWNSQDHDTRHEPGDWVHHIALACLQDRPNSAERLLFSLTGGLGIGDPLF